MSNRIMKRAGITAAAAATGVIGFVNVGTAHAESHVVEPGETLFSIAGSDYAAVAAANGIANPDVIYPGQVIDLDGGGSGAPAPEAGSGESGDEAPVEDEAAPVQDEAAAVAPSSGSSAGGTVWDDLAQCESTGDWSINTGNGYYGGLQFTQSSWAAAGGSGSPENASREEQIRVAENLLDMQGWGAWPTCSAELGLR